MLRTVLAEVHILICQVVVKQDEISEVWNAWLYELI